MLSIHTTRPALVPVRTQRIQSDSFSPAPLEEIDGPILARRRCISPGCNGVWQAKKVEYAAAEVQGVASQRTKKHGATHHKYDSGINFYRRERSKKETGVAVLLLIINLFFILRSSNYLLGCTDR